jgi:hypothetical protein
VEREIRTLEEALSLLDEWTGAYRELERHYILLDRAWTLKHDEVQMEMFRLHGQLCDYWLAEATERAANQEANGVEPQENPFA